MKEAFIGHSGFVGSNLKLQHRFTNLYNSKNFREMGKKRYDLVVCAGISAQKWIANKNPKKDKSKIKELQDVLKTIETKKFVLISTIDVYPILRGKDEDFNFSDIDNHAYGKHRHEFEIFCSETFLNCTIVRLPGLFGKGLKKNIIFDLLNDNCLEMINEKSSFQFYNLKFLWGDIKKVMENDIRIINLVNEPIVTKDILMTFFPSKMLGQKAISEVHYDLHTQYAHHWGKDVPYIYTKEEIMQQLLEFISGYEKNRKDV